MTICDRCEGKAAVVTSNCTVYSNGVRQLHRELDLCKACVESLKREITRFLEPLAKAAKQK